MWQKWITPPVFKDEMQTRLAHTLYIILWTFFVAAVSVILVCLVVGFYRTATALAAGLLVGGMALKLARKGALRIASLLISLVLLGIVIYLQYIGEGLNDVVTSVYPLVIITAGLLLDLVAFIGLTALCVVAAALIFYGQLNGSIAAPFASVTTIGDLMGVEATLIVTAVAVRVLVERFRRSEEESHLFQKKLQTLHEVTIELSRIRTLDELYRQAIILGREKLGFDRLGLLLLEEKTTYMVGTFGTDDQGNLRDERGFRQKIDFPELMDILANKKRLGFWKESSLVDYGRVIGFGWNAMAVLWNGDKGIGWLATDNLIKREPPSQTILEILVLYGAVLGQLLTLKQAEESLRTSEQRLSAHMKNTPLAFFEFDLDFHIIACNQAAEVIFGYSLAEAVGRTATELIVPADTHKYVHQVWDDLVHQQGGTRGTNRNVTKDGRMIICEWYNTPLVNQTGQIVGVASMALDITQRIQTEAERDRLIAELRAKNDELERFTYTISHDLKSPLVTVKGFLGFLEKDLKAGHEDRVWRDMTRIREAADNMQILLEELLELSRIGRLMNPPQIIPFDQLVQEAIKLVSGQINERKVQVEVQPNLPMVRGDRQRLIEVLQNLLDNAVKFMGDQPNPRIEIGARQEDTELLFFVRDNGSGIDPAYHEKVFELFERLSLSIEGTGIGLALAKRIVEVHNGRIGVESAGVGHGSTFYFTLPLA